MATDPNPPPPPPVERTDVVTEPRDEDTIEDRTQEVVPEHVDVLVDPHHDDTTAAEAAEQADPGATAADPGA